ELKRNRSFNAREERKLFGAPLRAEGEEPKEDGTPPSLGFYAFGLATAVVGGSALLGGWLVARFMGVKDVSPAFSFFNGSVLTLSDGRVLLTYEGGSDI
nr:hypothetical protein [Tanacetum cinerariifolium]